MAIVFAGKTTFIKNLFASYTQDPNLKVNDVPGPTSKDTFESHPDQLLTEIVVRDERNLIAYHYRVQDTPGQASSCISSHTHVPKMLHSYALVQLKCYMLSSGHQACIVCKLGLSLARSPQCQIVTSARSGRIHSSDQMRPDQNVSSYQTV